MNAHYRQPWTYRGIMAVPGFSLFLINVPCPWGKPGDRTTVSMVAYTDASPVVITEK